MNEKSGEVTGVEPKKNNFICIDISNKGDSNQVWAVHYQNV